MKLASYLADGKPAFGVVADDGVIDMTDRLRGRYATLRAALTPEGLDAIRQAVKGASPDHTLAQVQFLPAIPDPEKIFCAGINYRSHAAETGRDLPK